MVTVVHHADDTRIREKTIRTLEQRWDIRYRTRLPAPTDVSGITWEPLSGGRVVRNLAAFRSLIFGSYDVAQVHDPELVPAAVVARFLRRKRIVFDVHENVPAQIATKEWVPLPRAVATAVAWVLRAAEPILDITLAEAGYRALFAREHPVFPNYPDFANLPSPRPTAEGPDFVYVGGVTEQRGLRFLVDVVPVGTSLAIVGPCDPSFGEVLQSAALMRGVHLDLPGRLPHRDAMELCSRASVAVSPLLDTPNYRHSLPTKVLEYLALGLPVVASDLPGTREIVAGEPTVRLVESGDAIAWSQTLAATLEAASSIRSQARPAEVEERYRWPEDEFLTFYDTLL